MSLETLLSRLDHLQETGSGSWRARCPSHQGTSKTSLKVTEGDTGTVLVHCFGGCSFEAIIKKVGLTPSDLFPSSNVIKLSRASRKPRKDYRAIVHQLPHSATTILLAAEYIQQGKTLSEDDMCDLKKAYKHILKVAL